jgi:hypothetical protein
MDFFFQFAAFVLIGLFALMWARSRKNKWEQMLQGLAAANEGLEFKGGSLAGSFRGRSVQLDTITRGSGKSKKTFTRARSDADMPASITIGSENLFTQLAGSLGMNDYELGDPAFDGSVRLAGPQGELLARLDADTRRMVAAAVAEGLAIRDGTVTMEVRGRVLDPDKALGMLTNVTGVATSLERPHSVAACLAERALDRREPSSVRALALDNLESAPEALLKTLADDSAVSLRVAARRRLEDQRGLIAIAGDARVSTTSRFDALEAASTLGPLPGGTCEAFLLSELDANQMLRAIPLLELVGTVASVPALTEAGSGIWPGPAKRAANSAIRAIQSRIVGAERGGVSLAGAKAGGVSIAQRDSDERARRAQRRKQAE